MKQYVKGNQLITVTEREIQTRAATIRDNGDGTYRYDIYVNGEKWIGAEWPPPGWTGAGPEPPLAISEERVILHPNTRLCRLRDYIETVQFGGRVNIGWHKDGNTWFSDTLLGDSGGNGFNEAELQLIREAQKPKTKTKGQSQ